MRNKKQIEHIKLEFSFFFTLNGVRKEKKTSESNYFQLKTDLNMNIRLKFTTV